MTQAYVECYDEVHSHYLTTHPICIVLYRASVQGALRTNIPIAKGVPSVDGNVERTAA